MFGRCLQSWNPPLQWRYSIPITPEGLSCLNAWKSLEINTREIHHGLFFVARWWVVLRLHIFPDFVKSLWTAHRWKWLKQYCSDFRKWFLWGPDCLPIPHLIQRTRDLSVCSLWTSNKNLVDPNGIIPDCLVTGPHRQTGLTAHYYKLLPPWAIGERRLSNGSMARYWKAFFSAWTGPRGVAVQGIPAAKAITNRDREGCVLHHWLSY